MQYAVLDRDTGQLLEGRGAHKQATAASLTKVMALYVVSQAIASPHTNFNLGSGVKIPRIINDIPGTAAAIRSIKPGQIRNLQQLLVNAGSRSDAISITALAVATADAYGWKGSEASKLRQFVGLMNEQAEKLGMRDSHFTDVVGLRADNISTPYDIATLFHKFENQYPRLAEISLGEGRSSRYAARNPNDTDLVKTGYTRAAGFNLAVAGQNTSGDELIAAVFGARSKHHRVSTMTDLMGRDYVRQPAIITAAYNSSSQTAPLSPPSRYVRASLAGTFQEQSANDNAYIVKPGDNLTRIAARYNGVSAQDIKYANLDVVKKDGELIHPGDRLRIPGLEAPITASLGEGGSLWKLAKDRFAIPAAKIDQFSRTVMAANEIDDPRAIRHDRELSIPTQALTLAA